MPVLEQTTPVKTELPMCISLAYAIMDMSIISFFSASNSANNTLCFVRFQYRENPASFGFDIWQQDTCDWTLWDLVERII